MAAALAPVAADAQVIDQYLNPIVPAYGAAPGVTFVSRTQSEYDAQGVRLGSFTLSPVLTETLGYDNNVFATPQPRGSAVIETNASFTAASNWTAGSLGLALMVDNSAYPETPQQSFTNWNIAAGASHDFGRDTLYFGMTHLNLNQTPRDLDAPALQSPIAYRVDDVRGSYNVDLGRVAIQPGIDVSFYGFDNGIVQGVRYLQDYRDRAVYSPSVTGSYELANGRRIVVVLHDTQADFHTAPPGNARETFNDAAVLAGVAYDADGVVGFRLLGGCEERSFASSQYRRIQAPILEAAVAWTPTELTTITGSSARYIEDSAAEATIGYTETALKLNLDHEYSRTILLNMHSTLYLDDYSQGGGSQSFFTLGVGITWRLNRNLRLTTNYTYNNRYTRRNGNADLPFGSVFGGNFSENLFIIRVQVGL